MILVIVANYHQDGMELRHIRYFLAVAEELSFRRAAGKLRVAQPSLSSQIRQLEEEIQVRLLERDTHRVVLTAAGRSFMESCRRTMRDVEDTTRTAQLVSRGEAGKISIGFVASLGLGLLPAIAASFLKWTLVWQRWTHRNKSKHSTSIGSISASWALVCRPMK
jgi:DNA-binding transcriptional LysR family regulator